MPKKYGWVKLTDDEAALAILGGRAVEWYPFPYIPRSPGDIVRIGGNSFSEDEYFVWGEIAIT